MYYTILYIFPWIIKHSKKFLSTFSRHVIYPSISIPKEKRDPEIQLLVFSINLSLFKNLNPKVDFVEQLRSLNVEKSCLSPSPQTIHIES
jgi:hypothetical protein